MKFLRLRLAGTDIAPSPPVLVSIDAIIALHARADGGTGLVVNEPVNQMWVEEPLITVYELLVEAGVTTHGAFDLDEYRAHFFVPKED